MDIWNQVLFGSFSHSKGIIFIPLISAGRKEMGENFALKVFIGNEGAINKESSKYRE
jgi:hypothetical protein